MVEHIINCPCCNRQLKILIDDDSGEIIDTTVFFDDQNDTDESNVIKKLEETGIYFGCKGGGD